MRKPLWLPVLLIATLILGACGTARAPATAPQSPSGEVFMLALPRLVVDVDSSGSPVIFGINAGDFGRLIGSDLGGLRVPPDTVRQMTAANVQHIEIRQSGDAAVFLVNGKPLPHVGWNDASLAEASTLASVAGIPNTDILARMLPLVRRLGLDLVVRFPRAGQAAEIPLGDVNQQIAAQPTKDLPSAIAHFEVKYDSQGIPGVMGISAADLARLGMRLRVQLTPDAIGKLQANNVQTLEVRSRADGFYLFVNGNQLPNLIWDGQMLQNATDLYTQLNPNSPNNPVVALAGPWLDKADVDLIFHFPIKQGEAAIPVKMHE